MSNAAAVWHVYILRCVDSSLPPTEPMAYIKDIHDHYKWPDNWDLPS